MFAEYFNLALDWCKQQKTQKYLIGYIKGKYQKQLQEQCINSVSFIGDSFRIVVSIQEQFTLIIIYSEQLLIDPGKCSFLQMDNPPFFPIMDKEFNKEHNPKYPINYNQRVEIFKQTFDRTVARRSIIPLLACPKTVLALLWEYFIQQDSYMELTQDIQEQLLLQSRNVKLINALIANTLIEACFLFQKFISLKPKLTQEEITQDILNLTFLNFEHSLDTYQNAQFSPIFSNGRFVQQMMVLVNNMIQFFFNSIEETLDILTDNEFRVEELEYVLQVQIENQVGKFTVQMHEFALIEQADFIILFEKIKETIYSIVKDIEMFVVDLSIFVHAQMGKVNKIFEDFPALANIRTFQTIQVDVSNHIVDKLKSHYLQDKSNFWRLESKGSTKLIKKLIVYYINYDKPLLQLPTKTNDFSNSLVRMGLDSKMPIQTIQIILNQNETDFIAKKDDFNVLRVQMIEQNNKKKANILYLDNNEEVILQIINNNVVLMAKYLINQQMWTNSGESQIIEPPTTLSQMVNKIVKSDIEYQKMISLHEKQSAKFANSKKQSKLLVYFSLEMNDSLKLVKEQLTKKHQKTQRVGANVANPECIAAGAVGSGLGILIVDCLDENIPWNQKLQRAGYGTVETTAYAALSMQLPFIGFLLSQTFLFYSIHKVFSNKVVNMPNKIKNIGHLGVKTTMGIGSALVGQIFIPIPVLGALIGSFVGGVGVGLYHRFVIPNTRNSILNMVAKLRKQILPNGELEYDKSVLEILKISPTHFFDNKPLQLTSNQWLSLVAMHLVNEIQYLYEIQCADLRKKYLEKEEGANKIKLLVELENQQEQIEIMFIDWELCRMYVADQKISSFRFAYSLGVFVQGMMANFKL